MTDFSLQLSGGETNYVERNQLRAKPQVLSTNPHLPRALGPNLPLGTGWGLVSGVCSGEANHDSSRAQEPELRSLLPVTCILWLERIFGWVGWMALCYEEQKVKSLFYADDTVLLSPTRNGLITVRRNGSGWTAPNPSCHFWQMLSNMELAFIQQPLAGTHPFSHAGLHFPTQSLGDSSGGDTCWILGVCGCSVRMS